MLHVLNINRHIPLWTFHAALSQLMQEILDIVNWQECSSSAVLLPNAPQRMLNIHANLWSQAIGCLVTSHGGCRAKPVMIKKHSVQSMSACLPRACMFIWCCMLAPSVWIQFKVVFTGIAVSQHCSVHEAASTLTVHSHQACLVCLNETVVCLESSVCLDECER